MYWSSKPRVWVRVSSGIYKAGNDTPIVLAAFVAQLVERGFEAAQAFGSNPDEGTTWGVPLQARINFNGYNPY